MTFQAVHYYNLKNLKISAIDQVLKDHKVWTGWYVGEPHCIYVCSISSKRAKEACQMLLHLARRCLDEKRRKADICYSCTLTLEKYNYFNRVGFTEQMT